MPAKVHRRGRIVFGFNRGLMNSCLLAIPIKPSLRFWPHFISELEALGLVSQLAVVFRTIFRLS